MTGGVHDAMAGLERALRHGPIGGDLIVQPWRAEYRARMELPYDRPGLPPGRALFDGYGDSMARALVHLWFGELGVWRHIDPEGWAAVMYPAGRPAASNPGPQEGQRLGRGGG